MVTWSVWAAVCFSAHLGFYGEGAAGKTLYCGLYAIDDEGVVGAVFYGYHTFSVNVMVR